MENPGLRHSEALKRRVKNVEDLDQLRHGVHGNARGKYGHGGEGNGIEAAGLFIKAQAQVFRHGASPRAVVKGHHEDAHKYHRRNGANPIKVAGLDAILRARGSHTDDFLRTQISREEGQSGDPGWNGTSRKKEVRARAHRTLQHHSDSKDENEVDAHDDPVNGAKHESMPPRAATLRILEPPLRRA